jgi:hypothetical protein
MTTIAKPSEEEIGRELVQLLNNEMVIAVDPDLQVRVRIYATDKKTILIDVATSAQRALSISSLFAKAAMTAQPTLGRPVAVTA